MAYADFRHPDAPLIRSQASGSYWLVNGEALSLSTSRSDNDKLGPCSILKMGPSDYRLWIEMVALGPNRGGTTSYGQSGSFDGDTTVGYATGTDGTSWTFRDVAGSGGDSFTPDRVLTPATTTNPAGGSTAWMNGESSVGTVIWDTDAQMFKLWGHGGNNTGPRAIYYATSSDGIAWTLQNNGQPIFQRNLSGWDDGRVDDARVVKVSSSLYVMHYRGTRSAGDAAIGRATSTDGVSWTRYGTSPVLDSSGSGWNALSIYVGQVLYDPATGHMHMWYAGDDVAIAGGTALGYAFSDDLGQTWTNSPRNPVIALSASGLDSASLGDTISAYRDGTTYRINYGAEKFTPNGLSGTFRGRLEATTPASPLAPDFVGVGTASFSSTNGQNLTPGLPSGWADGDIHVLVGHRSDNTAATSLTGWTQLYAQNNTTAQRVEVWWRRAVAGDTAPTFTFGSSTIVRGAWIFGVRGCPTGRSPINLSSISANAASATVSTSNISPATAPTLGVFAWAYEDDPTAATTPAGPTDQVGWTAPTITTSSLGNDMSLGVCSRKWVQSGSYGTPSTVVSGGTFTNSPNVGLLFAFDPLEVDVLPPHAQRIIRLRR